MKLVKFFCILLFVGTGVFASAQVLYRDTIPEWLIPLRDAYFEQTLSVEETEPLYAAAKIQAEKLSPDSLRLDRLAWCEFWMGKVCAFYKQSKSAIQYYKNGEKLAEESLESEKTADAYLVLSSCISELCTLRNKLWVMTHGLDVAKYAKKALVLDPQNGAAQNLIAGKYAYAPKGLGSDPEKGIAMFKDILSGKYNLQKDDVFTSYCGMAYAAIVMKDKNAAEEYIRNALTIYPSNKFVGVELRGKMEKL
jgi:tetratricopeptide (TPR) repeat protein